MDIVSVQILLSLIFVPSLLAEALQLRDSCRKLTEKEALDSGHKIANKATFREF